MGYIPGLKVVRWQSKAESQLGPCAFRITKVTRRMGYLSSAEFLGIRVGMLAEKSEYRCQLSLQCSISFEPTAWSCNHSPGRGPAKGRSVVRPHMVSLGGRVQVCTTGVCKIWRLKTQSHAWDKNSWSQAGWTQSLNWNQGDKSNCCSVRAHWRVEGGSSQLQGRDLGATILILPISTESLQRAEEWHVVESGAADTEPGPLTGEGHFHKYKDTWKSSKWTPPQGDQQKQLAHTNFTDHKGLQSFSSWRKQYIAFFLFFNFQFYFSSYLLIFFYFKIFIAIYTLITHILQ